MSTSKPRPSRKPPAKRSPADRTKFDAPRLLTELEQLGDAKTRDELLPRYGIAAPKAFGVSMAKIQALAKRVGRNHALAQALWDTGWYEARLLASYVDDPARVTSAQMDQWCRDFDNWAVVDTVCFKLFDQVEPSMAFAKVDRWSVRDGPRDEFVKRAGLALLACLALHEKRSPDEAFLSRLPLVERGAADERNFVKKGARWALLAIGGRSNPLKTAALALADRLVESPAGSSSRWVGKEAVKALRK